MDFDSEGSDERSLSSFEVGIYDDDQIQAEGIHATIYRTEMGENSQNRVSEIRAVKTVTAFKNARLEPHDVRSEAYGLARLRHKNIIELLDASYSHQQKLFQIFMPFIPLTLYDLLENPECSPYLPPKQAPESGKAPRLNLQTVSRFRTLAKSFLFQIVSAVAFLHTNNPPVAHRDLKPSNILVCSDGCIKLIDFGISWEGRPRGRGGSFEEDYGNNGNGRLNGFIDAPKPEWDETPERMCCQVSSGAPELLFAPQQYDAYASDLWSLGVLASGFFTSVRFEPKHAASAPREFDWDALVFENDGSAHDPDTINNPLDATIPFNVPDSVTNMDRTGSWHRMTLFDSTRGEIGLVASIFKLLGTPTETTWPDFNALPAASALVFSPMPPRPLRPLLPNLIPGETPASRSEDLDYTRDSEDVLSLIQGLVRYPPRLRTSASDLLHHSYFHQGSSLILPPAYFDADCDEQPPQVESDSLADFISQLIATSSDEGSNRLE